MSARRRRVFVVPPGPTTLARPAPFLHVDSPSSTLGPTRKCSRYGPPRRGRRWTEQEDELLIHLVRCSLNPDWHAIATHFPSKSHRDVAYRYTRVLDPNIVKGNWTQEEDQKILDWVQENGEHSWGKLALVDLPGRIGKQIRERFYNTLKPGVQNGEWSPSEDALLMELHSTWGNRWEKIAEFIPNRAANSIKNRWNSVTRAANQVLVRNTFDGDHPADCRPVIPTSH